MREFLSNKERHSVFFLHFTVTKENARKELDSFHDMLETYSMVIRGLIKKLRNCIYY